MKATMNVQLPSPAAIDIDALNKQLEELYKALKAGGYKTAPAPLTQQQPTVVQDPPNLHVLTPQQEKAIISKKD